MADKLLPCPFCGGEAEVFDYFNQGKQKTRWQVNCTKCMGAFGENDSKDEAIEKWNKRVNVPLYGEVEGDWHTGTPTEEGWFLVKYRWTGGGDVTRTMIYRALEMKMSDYDGRLYSDQEPTSEYWELYEWQKIEPYRG